MKGIYLVEVGEKSPNTIQKKLNRSASVFPLLYLTNFFKALSRK